jgi:hypothetical protein
MRILIIGLCFLLAEAYGVEANYTVSPSPFPGFLQLTSGNDNRDVTNIAIATIVEIRADGRGCLIICEMAGQHREYPTRAAPLQLGALMAQAKAR